MFLSVLLMSGFAVAAPVSFGRNVIPHGREGGGVVVGSPLAGHEGVSEFCSKWLEMTDRP